MSIYPECATDECTNRARGRRPGAKCKKCRRDAGDPTVVCTIEGCGNIRFTLGLCAPCLRAGKNGLPPRQRVSQRRCEIVGCRLAVYDMFRCDKHRANPNACIMKGCAQPVVDRGKCDKHKPGPEGTCSVLRCPSPRFKAGLCYKHHKKRALQECGYPLCANATSDTYCRLHDIGIDFAAGDWFDWVAVEQMLAGRCDPDRQPTVPELEAVRAKARERGVTKAQLAERLGVGFDRFDNWMRHVDRLAGVDAKQLEVAA